MVSILLCRHCRGHATCSRPRNGHYTTILNDRKHSGVQFIHTVTTALPVNLPEQWPFYACSLYCSANIAGGTPNVLGLGPNTIPPYLVAETIPESNLCILKPLQCQSTCRNNDHFMHAHYTARQILQGAHRMFSASEPTLYYHIRWPNTFRSHIYAYCIHCNTNQPAEKMTIYAYSLYCLANIPGVMPNGFCLGPNTILPYSMTENIPDSYLCIL